MTVVNVRNKMDDLRDQFPVGMRVLAVDDDPTCLSVLEKMLLKCNYQVTTTMNAKSALKLLRENKNKYDLVISDVHMPDMDGFKLLELVGLEMDLPVIMLSVNDDPKMVMKGITHGACDYLLKPVRTEELQNIWQHVIRRKKIDSKDRNITSNNQNNPNSQNGRGSVETQHSDQNGKPSKKRKDQDEDEEEEHENNHDYEESTTQKKARVVWSVDLHRQFVIAVNQLGIDKAVPKKILDLMNVENLTRENVASHLQKYRLYLKRISCVQNQQANMVAALGSADPSYLRMRSLSGIGNLQTLSGSRQFLNNKSFRPFQPGGMIGSLNIPSGLNLHSLPSSGPLQLGHAQNLNNSSNDQFKFQSGIVGGNNQNGIQGMTLSSTSPMQNLNNLIDANRANFPSFSSKLSDQKPKVSTMGYSPSPLLDISNNALMLQANSITVTPQNSSSQFGRGSSDVWSNSMISTSFQGGNLSGASSITSLASQSPNSLKDMQGGIFTNTPNPFQSWDDQSHDIASSMDSFPNHVDPQGHINSTFNRNIDSNFGDPLQMKHDGMRNLGIVNQLMSQNSRVSNNSGGLLDELAVAMMIRKQDKVKSVDGSFSSDNNNFSGGTPM